MKENYSEAVKGVSLALRRMHRALFEAEMADGSQASSAESPHDQMQRLMNDPALAWLRPITDLITELDHWLASEPVIERTGAFAARRKAEALFGPYASERQHAIQRAMANLTYRHPNVTMALGDLRRALAALPGDDEGT